MRGEAITSAMATMLLVTIFVTATALTGGEAGQIVTLKVEGLTCPSCAYKVKAALEKVPGVLRAKVSWWEGEALVEFRVGAVTVSQLIEAVKGAGYAARPLEVSR